MVKNWINERLMSWQMRLWTYNITCIVLDLLLYADSMSVIYRCIFAALLPLAL